MLSFHWKAAVELQALLVLYAPSLPLQLWCSPPYKRGVVAALFWTLMPNGVVATQEIEDGTLSSLVGYFQCFPGMEWWC